MTWGEAFLRTALAEVTDRLAGELELNHCLAEYGEECSDEEPCAYHAGWVAVEYAGALLETKS